MREIEAWIEQRANLEHLREELAARTLPEQIGQAVAWFNRAPVEEARLVAADLLAQWARLRTVLKRLQRLD